MFPFQQSYDLGFGTPATSQGSQIQDDLITDYNFLENNLINFSIGTNDGEVSKATALGLRGQKQKQSSSSSKKTMQREVERKRRQEMSDLYASLRSLLPDHHIKGKRGVCDQIQVAESHIKTMEKNIQELKTRRNKLNSLFNSSSGNEESSNGRDNVTINLGELQRSDLDVVSAVSTRMKDRFVHKIQVEALGMTNLGALVLQERLIKAIM